jgi:hypothetical protein
MQKLKSCAALAALALICVRLSAQNARRSNSDRRRHRRRRQRWATRRRLVIEAAQIDLSYGITTVRDSYGALLPLTPCVTPSVVATKLALGFSPPATSVIQLSGFRRQWPEPSSTRRFHFLESEFLLDVVFGTFTVRLPPMPTRRKGTRRRTHAQCNSASSFVPGFWRDPAVRASPGPTDRYSFRRRA